MMREFIKDSVTFMALLTIFSAALIFGHGVEEQMISDAIKAGREQ